LVAEKIFERINDETMVDIEDPERHIQTVSDENCRAPPLTARCKQKIGQGVIKARCSAGNK
jgi:hypothetical protein